MFARYPTYDCTVITSRALSVAAIDAAYKKIAYTFTIGHLRHASADDVARATSKPHKLSQRTDLEQCAVLSRTPFRLFPRFPLSSSTMTRALLGAFLLIGLFSEGWTLVCDTCHDKCNCLKARQEFCPPSTFCYTITNVLGQAIRKGCAEDCNSFSGECRRCDTDYCNRSVRGAYLPSGYEDCENYNYDAGSYDRGHVGDGVNYGGSGGATYGGGPSIGQGAGVNYGGSGIGQGAGYGGSGIGQGAGYGGHGYGEGGYDPYNQYGHGGVGIGQGAQPRPGIGQGAYPMHRGSATTMSVMSSVLVVVGAVYILV
uniref:Variant-specific surface protein n=2 Tax=Steinernema glaseri TaxID=37863 RepID=A0A1I7ZQ31_9BILA